MHLQKCVITHPCGQSSWGRSLQPPCALHHHLTRCDSSDRTVEQRTRRAELL